MAGEEGFAVWRIIERGEEREKTIRREKERDGRVCICIRMHIAGRDTIDPIVLIPQLPPSLIIKAPYLCVRVLQIRQEKPYYIADPEVDSLVSISLFAMSQKPAPPSSLVSSPIISFLAFRSVHVRSRLIVQYYTTIGIYVATRRARFEAPRRKSRRSAEREEFNCG